MCDVSDTLSYLEEINSIGDIRDYTHNVEILFKCDRFKEKPFNEVDAIDEDQSIDRSKNTDIECAYNYILRWVYEQSDNLMSMYDWSNHLLSTACRVAWIYTKGMEIDDFIKLLGDFDIFLLYRRGSTIVEGIYICDMNFPIKSIFPMLMNDGMNSKLDMLDSVIVCLHNQYVHLRKGKPSNNLTIYAKLPIGYFYTMNGLLERTNRCVDYSYTVNRHTLTMISPEIMYRGDSDPSQAPKIPPCTFENVEIHNWRHYFNVINSMNDEYQLTGNEMLNDPYVRISLAIVDNQVVGYIVSRHSPYLSNEILQIYVKEEYRNKGIGSALLLRDISNRGGTPVSAMTMNVRDVSFVEFLSKYLYFETDSTEITITDIRGVNGNTDL